MSAELVSPSGSYAAEVARLLWPAPWGTPQLTRARRPAGSSHRDVYLFPSDTNPRLLVPADLPGSSVMIRRLGGSRSGWAGPARRVLERTVRSRAFPLLGWPRLRVQGDDPDADSIERHLTAALGAEVRVGVLLGTRRVNQKPVLQLFGADGAVLGYAKIGHNELTSALVRREAAALTALAAAQPQRFRAPRVLHHDSWGGLEVLVMSPLASGDGPRVPRTARIAAAGEVIRLGNPTTTTLGQSAYFTRLVARALGLTQLDGADRLLDCVEVLAQRHGGDALTFGGWHGDWGHWNMAMSQGVLQVWDWERHEPDVPLGFDELHFAAQSVRPEERAAGEQERAFLAACDAHLARLDVPSGQHRLTLLLYLAEMSARYLEALRHGATPVLRLRTDWVASLLERQLHHPGHARNGES
ncbi:hypothetical protein [Nocardioides sp. SYSU D00065]|uniref:hypothetical protein n=1 Tax=Nocardioides sp. SYSU D00065 TaxID=2817378 RepID=UPI001B31D5B8|nr:hypothetical protein [Nocardioides sp. SYSU D00065]